ncbi:uncharacterized protein LOC107046416 [Diachasma alloeum]|uniref:uncharacterized protein LOC107046416 n=1 Tax=Diachasma alloeum TaxID=454923 RepID=UPI0007385166|nr:uncharacterized protein LOC107046416 [Diachasma alloeum]
MKLQTGDDATIKALGLHWDSKNDSIVYTVHPIPLIKKVTKRIVSSDLTKMFDPLGLVGPVIMKGKLIMQQLWKEKLGWDDPVPISINTEWKAYLEQLPLLNNTQFRRKTILANATEIQLHGFCDASDKGYEAYGYLRTPYTNETQTYLLCAKSRVAPINKEATIPRLELRFTLLLAELIDTIKNTITQRIDQWRHVRTDDNPADDISKGCTPEEFTDDIKWKQGPMWLNTPEKQWPESKLTVPAEVPEIRKEECFSEDLKILRRGNELPPKDRWLAISQYLDAKGLIRVGELVRVKTQATDYYLDELREGTNILKRVARTGVVREKEI